jgi:ABC-type multidrug transport system ATPase subunit
LNVLCGKAFYGTTTGTLFINGQLGRVSDLKGHVGFVPQLDIVHTDLTVYENLAFAAAIKLPRATPFQKREKIVASTIELLGLKRVANTVVGDAEKRGISGGQVIQSAHTHICSQQIGGHALTHQNVS